MTREQIYIEKEMFGLVPSMFKEVPDDSLELEWKLFRRYNLKESDPYLTGKKRIQTRSLEVMQEV